MSPSRCRGTGVRRSSLWVKGYRSMIRTFHELPKTRYDPSPSGLIQRENPWPEPGLHVTKTAQTLGVSWVIPSRLLHGKVCISFDKVAPRSLARGSNRSKRQWQTRQPPFERTRLDVGICFMPLGSLRARQGHTNALRVTVFNESIPNHHE